MANSRISLSARRDALQVFNSESPLRSRTAFTLVELLVAVVVSATAASLLLPAVVRTRERARMATCSNNLRQAALFALGADYGDVATANRSIAELSEFQELLQCPSDSTNGRKDYRRTVRLIVSPTSQGDSRIVEGAWFRGAIRFKRLVRGTSKTLMYAEVAGLPVTYEGRPDTSPLGPHSSRVPTDVLSKPKGGFKGFYHHELGRVATLYSGMQINRTNRRGVFAFHDGAYVAMCDGSVALKRVDTDPTYMAAAFSRY